VASFLPDKETTSVKTVNTQAPGSGMPPSSTSVDRRRVLPTDPEGDNDRRARDAGTALEGFGEVTSTDDQDAVADLVTNVMHWCDRNGVAFCSELKRAWRSYDEETECPGTFFHGRRPDRR
jgi:hypothetical protein